MGDIVELVVTKGKTVKAPDREEWLRVEYSVKATVSCTEECHVAKAQLDAIVDVWLANASPSKGEVARTQDPLQGKKQAEKPKWNPAKINWTETQGSSGPYQRSEDVNSLDFKEMLKDLTNHGGRMTCDGYFYWVFRSGSVVGRKKRG
ncbi:MAG: hypothetical protein K6T73_08595 [Candidatus Bathyarchaeota archaeon]|nr:hypothetical protein [Candidatus Bathyarchaeota archaeon]